MRDGQNSDLWILLVVAFLGFFFARNILRIEPSQFFGKEDYEKIPSFEMVENTLNSKQQSHPVWFHLSTPPTPPGIPGFDWDPARPSPPEISPSSSEEGEMLALLRRSRSDQQKAPNIYGKGY